MHKKMSTSSSAASLNAEVPAKPSTPREGIPNGISFDDVVRKPAPRKLLRFEVIEYVKTWLQMQERSGFNSFGVKENAIEKFIENFAAIAK